MIKKQLAFKLLPAKAAVSVFARDCIQKTGRQMHPVCRCRRMGCHCRRFFEQIPKKRVVAWGRRHDLPRPLSESQPELQHIPSLVRLAPLGKFIAPRAIELGSTQRFWIACRENLCGRTVGPAKLLSSCIPFGTAIRRRTLKYPGFTKDHHFPSLIERFADECDPGACPRVLRSYAFNLLSDPFGSGPGLSGSPAS